MGNTVVAAGRVVEVREGRWFRTVTVESVDADAVTTRDESGARSVTPRWIFETLVVIGHAKAVA